MKKPLNSPVRKAKGQDQLCASVRKLLQIMARLRAPDGCPWDREQNHMTLRFHAVEEVYELIDAIEAKDDHEMAEELGDLLLQVVFHAQLAEERGAFNFTAVVQNLNEKLIRRHPHVFAQAEVNSVAGVWKQWEQIKHSEKKGTRHERVSALDGVPRHLPSLQRAQKLLKKAAKAGLINMGQRRAVKGIPSSRHALGAELLRLASIAQEKGWSAEEILRATIHREERELRKLEKKRG